MPQAPHNFLAFDFVFCQSLADPPAIACLPPTFQIGAARMPFFPPQILVSAATDLFFFFVSPAPAVN